MVRFEQIKKSVEQANEERDIVISSHKEIETKLKEQNEFADKLEEHEKVSHDHMHRIE